MVVIQPQQNYSNQSYDQGYDQSYGDWGSEGMPALQNPAQGAVYANKDPGFLKWLFSFTSESLEPLENNWLGNELDDRGRWVPSQDGLATQKMNRKGVRWGISLLKSYFNPVFFVTSMQDKMYNFRMRQISTAVLFSLYERHREFDLKTSDIPIIAEEIESKIGAILAGSLHDGYRIFLSTQNSNIENRQIISSEAQPNAGIFSRVSNSIFKNDQQGGQRQW